MKPSIPSQTHLDVFSIWARGGGVEIGFKINIWDVVIKYPRACSSFFWGVLVCARLVWWGGGGLGHPPTCFRVTRSPNGLFVNLEE